MTEKRVWFQHIFGYPIEETLISVPLVGKSAVHQVVVHEWCEAWGEILAFLEYYLHVLKCNAPILRQHTTYKIGYNKQNKNTFPVRSFFRALFSIGEEGADAHPDFRKICFALTGFGNSWSKIAAPWAHPRGQGDLKAETRFEPGLARTQNFSWRMGPRH